MPKSTVAALDPEVFVEKVPDGIARCTELVEYSEMVSVASPPSNNTDTWEFVRLDSIDLMNKE